MSITAAGCRWQFIRLTRLAGTARPPHPCGNMPAKMYVNPTPLCPPPTTLGQPQRHANPPAQVRNGTNTARPTTSLTRSRMAGKPGGPPPPNCREGGYPAHKWPTAAARPGRMVHDGPAGAKRKPPARAGGEGWECHVPVMRFSDGGVSLHGDAAGAQPGEDDGRWSGDDCCGRKFGPYRLADRGLKVDCRRC